MRTCIKCERPLPDGEFYANKAYISGVDARCKTCVRAYLRDYRNKNRAHQSQQGKDRYTANFEQARLQANAAAKVRRAWLTKTVKDRVRSWWLAHPGYQSVAKARRKATRLGLANTFSWEEWRLLKTEYGHRCLCCGKSEPDIQLVPDHIIAFADSGPNELDNIQPLCVDCNRQKQCKQVDYRTDWPAVRDRIQIKLAQIESGETPGSTAVPVARSRVERWMGERGLPISESFPNVPDGGILVVEDAMAKAVPAEAS